MITKIVVDGIATFKKKAVVETSKKVNLVYGLNGTGKSTICRILQDPDNDAYKACQVNKADSAKTLVFNDEFIQENFYLSEAIKGIFSLSKENKEAEERISILLAERSRAAEDRVKLESGFNRESASLQKDIDGAVDAMFDIKRDNSGGDRVLEYCLEGVMGKKEKLVERLLQVNKPIEEPTETVASLQEEARLLEKGASGGIEPLLSKQDIDLSMYELDPILSKAIVGAKNSNFSDFIDQLMISDWVKQGMAFIGKNQDSPSACPFCQADTIDDRVASSLASYFDKTYEDQLALLSKLCEGYELEKTRIEKTKPGLFHEDRISLLEDKLLAEIDANITLIKDKIRSPSISTALIDTRATIKELASAVDGVNGKIAEHNQKIANSDKSKGDISRRFWSLMRWKYDSLIGLYKERQKKLEALRSRHKAEISEIDGNVLALNQSIADAQKSTVNIDDAIESINSELINIGISDFRIEKHSEHLYRLDRPGVGSGSFKSLSEGEKMIIALLYFCELCAGKGEPDEVVGEKVAVFDDPVSSLSHLYVFNVGRLLQAKFFRGNLVSQVFVFTHSLYFFYELTDINHERRKESQALFRVNKGASGSTITPMKYEEIQNDYQSYWQLINDVEQHPAVIANCMRNVVEYFFGFVEKRDFNNVFQKPELQSNKFQSFSRYMNRESHSLGQNVFDMKEFDYETFREGLRLVFEVSGYPEHYKQMTKK